MHTLSAKMQLNMQMLELLLLLLFAIKYLEKPKAYVQNPRTSSLH